MKKFIRISTLLLFLSSTSYCQNIWELGGEYQYNCGRNLRQHDIGIRYDGFQAKSSWNLGITYNMGHTKSKDGSIETGIGLSAGYRYGFNFETKSNLFSGVRLTLEFDTWRDKDGKVTSKETVLVPKLEFGYQRLFGDFGHIYTTPSIGYGQAFKLNAEGEENKADEGGRFVIGLSAGYRF